jgi:hypothetical protein
MNARKKLNRVLWYLIEQEQFAYTPEQAIDQIETENIVIKALSLVKQ